MKRSSIVGGAPSVWFATNEIGFGKDQLSDFLGGANMLWRGDALYGRNLSGVIQSMMPEIRTRFRGEELLAARKRQSFRPYFRQFQHGAG